MKIDHSKIEDLVFDSIDHADHPDYVDAFLVSATYQGRRMTVTEIDAIDKDWLHEQILKEAQDG